MFTHFNSGARTSKKRPSEGNDHFQDQFTRHSNHTNLFFQLEPQHQIISESTLISTKDFRVIIKRCLLLLKQKAPDYYGLFCLFNIKIRATDEYETSANFDNSSIDIYGSLEDRSDAAIAAVLIHETIHFWQDESGSPHFGTEKQDWQDGNKQMCELEAIKYQLEILRRLGGAEDEIKFQEKQRGTHDGFIRYQP